MDRFLKYSGSPSIGGNLYDEVGPLFLTAGKTDGSTVGLNYQIGAVGSYSRAVVFAICYVTIKKTVTDVLGNRTPVVNIKLQQSLALSDLYSYLSTLGGGIESILK